MNRNRILALCLCCVLLAGCGKSENPYRVDTVVRIPVNPTEATAASEPTQPPETEAPAETAEATEATEAPKAPSGKTSTGGKSSSGKTSSGKSQSAGKKQETEETTGQGSITIISGSVKETEPKVIEIAATEPETEPPTEPPETATPTEAPYDPSDYSVGSLEYAIADEMNACRLEAELPELTVSSRLCGIAGLRARETAQFWGHTRPDGRDYTTAMSDYGYGFSTSAENLVNVSGSGDAAVIVSKWMNTSSKNNILNEDFTTAGIGIYRTGGVTYVVSLLVG